MEKHTGKTVLITGCSTGIGWAAAEAFLDAGCVVFATARRAESLTGLEAKGCRVLPLDVTDELSMTAAVQAIAAQTGGVDVLVNNAGYGLNGPVEELEMQKVRHEFETNVFGLVRLCQLVLPEMRHRARGRIINVGSIGGSFTAPGAGAYHASKYAVEAFTDALRAETKPFGIDVVLIKPTGVRTLFFNKINATLPQTGPQSPYAFFKENFAKITERMASSSGYGLTTPESVARIILRAATSPRPRTRYIAGSSGHLYLAMRKALPDRSWDALMALQFPVLPPKGTKPVHPAHH